MIMPLSFELPHSNAQLAHALGRSECYVSMMFRAGCPKDCGTRASLRCVLDWLKANPGFTVAAAKAIKPTYPRRSGKIKRT